MPLYRIVCEGNLHIGTKFFSKKKEKSTRLSNTMVSMNQDKIPHTNFKVNTGQG